MSCYLNKKIEVWNEKRWSHEAVMFLEGLLAKNAERRLGKHGIAELIEHPWMKGFDWQGLRERTIVSPFAGRVEIAEIDETPKLEKALSGNSDPKFINDFLYIRRVNFE